MDYKTSEHDHYIRELKRNGCYSDSHNLWLYAYNIGLFYGPQKKLELEKGKFKDNYI